MSFTTEQILSQARTIADIPLHRLSYVPSDEEAASIREAADELRVIDVQLTAQIANLLAQQATVRKQIAVNDALLAPIRRVPLELLSEIFLLAVPDDWDAAYAGQRKLGFVCVCHQWRDVALGTPRLWSKLRFGEYQNWETLSKDVGRLETELARTAQAHLDVVFEQRSRRFEIGPAPSWTYSDVWQLLFAQSHRWRSAQFDLMPLTVYEGIANCSFPALTALTFSVRGPQDVATRSPTYAFLHAPNVVRLSLEFRMPILAFDLPGMWNIVDLTLAINCQVPVAPKAFVDALRACRSTLRTCHIAVSHELIDPPICEPAALLRLEDLYLFRNAIFLCNHIACPNLKKLRISGSHQFGALYTLLDRSAGCKSLRSMTLNNLYGASAQVIASCLRHLPQLTELLLVGDDFEELLSHSFITVDLVRALHRTGGNHATEILPNLSHLAIDLGGWTDSVIHQRAHCEALFAMLKSRAEPQERDGVNLQPLQSFILGGTGCWPPSMESLMNVFQNRQINY
ncbi:hypothetical protein K523DRAFT_295326 [Schizophyllum commune Tattone D]|nr:hypothetical protein K523DRAFT_295326 [Schizophyllum commune Tattone D]